MLENLLNQDEFILFGHHIKNHISIGSVSIYFYALAIVTGMILCCVLAIPVFKKRGVPPDFILDIMIWVIPLSIICARTWYVLFDIKTFIDSPKGFFLSAINIRDGGLAIYGGVVGGALGIVIACKIKKVGILKIFDIGGAMRPLGQAIGRWGNFFNQEVYGQEITNPAFQFFPIGVEIENGGTVGWYQALFFYESVLDLALFIGLYLYLRKRKSDKSGYAMSFYFIGYGLIRAILEGFRQSEYNLPLFGNTGIRAMILVSALLIAGGLICLTFFLKRDGYIFKGKKAASGEVPEDAPQGDINTEKEKEDEKD